MNTIYRLLLTVLISTLVLQPVQADNTFRKQTDIYFQNMGLLVAPASYKGFDRRASIAHLIQRIKDQDYDIVALAEAFKDDERDRIANAFPDMYRLDGPDGPFYDLRSDGGLFLLSRYPIKERHEYIFEDPAGADWFALKGIIHARVHIPNYDNDFDIFVTHLQNDDEGGTDSQLDVTLAQAAKVQAFVDRHTANDNTAIIMGDFNLDGLKPEIAAARDKKMPRLLDLWKFCESVGPGITLDKLGDFTPESTHNPLSQRELATRSSDGERLDYFFVMGKKPTQQAGDCNVRVITEQLKTRFSKGQLRDMSDHYGLTYTFDISRRNFAAIWRKKNNDTLIERNYKKADFYDLWLSMNDSGYKLIDIEFSNNLWHGVFKKGSGQYAMWRDYSLTGFDAKWREMSSKGYRLYDLETYTVNGKRKWAGLFKKGTGKYALWSNHSTSSFADKRRLMAEKGMKLIDIEVYAVNNTLKWSGVWIEGEDGLLNRNYDDDKFNDLVKSRSTAGYKMIDIETYVVNGNRKWAGIWEKSDEVQQVKFTLNTTSFFSQESTLDGAHDKYTGLGYELLDIENY